MAGSSQRNAIAVSIGWWYLKRRIRKRGAAAVAGLVAGEGLSLSGRSQKRHPVRWLVVLGLAAGAGVLWWRSTQPEPEPEPEPVAT